MSSLLKKPFIFSSKSVEWAIKYKPKGIYGQRRKKKVKQLLCTGYVISCIVYTLLDFHLINKQGLSLVDSR